MLFVAIVVVLVVSLGFNAAFFSQSRAGSGGSSEYGISLLVRLSATTISVGQNLSVTITLANTLPEENTVANTGSFNVSIVGFQVAVWPTCDFPLPVEFVVAKGNLSLSDLQRLLNSGAAYTPPQDDCGQWHVKSLTFQPDSDVAALNVTPFGPVGPNMKPDSGPFTLSSNFTLYGYWDYPIPPSEAPDLYTPYGDGFGFMYPEVSPIPAHSFGPGVYTLAVDDEWGQVEILHFTVVG